MSALAAREGAVNLAQGFPDFDGPLEIRQLAAQAILDGPNQYVPSMGVAPLREAVAAKMRRFYNIQVNPDTQVTITAGSTEGLAATLLGIIEPGDEVILLDPSYDLYPAVIARAGGIPVHVALHGADFALPEETLARAFSNRTRAIVINNPQNPCGKVFSDEELRFIAALCEKWDAIAIGDEVYEHLIYDDAVHRTLLSIPGLEDRSVVISSTAKTFSMTGWKVGMVVACEPLTDAVRAAHQFLTFCTPGVFQHAMAAAIASDDHYYSKLRTDYDRRRHLLGDALNTLGYEVLWPRGTYFLNVRIDRDRFGDDVAFCEMLATTARVAAIPTSYFFENRAGGKDTVRFCFCKQDATLALAIERLRAWKK